MHTEAVIFKHGSRYAKLAECAVRSFQKFHPTVQLHYVNEQNLAEYIDPEVLNNIPVGIVKFMVAQQVALRARSNGHKQIKLIVLGADTITCSRLDEFLDEDRYDILATLDYPYQLVSGNIKSPDSETHLNADVVCFNNMAALMDVIRAASNHPVYFEQGGLNEVAWSKYSRYSVNIVDNYQTEKVVYNARAKGNIYAGPGQKPWRPYIQKFQVRDGKLFTWDNKQIKVWHYCEGFGVTSQEEFVNLINGWINNMFNEETKRFFTEVCDTGSFFTQSFEL